MNAAMPLVRLIEVNMGIDGPREHQQTACVDHFIARCVGQVPHRLDRLALDQHILLRDGLAHYDRPTPDQNRLLVQERLPVAVH